MRVLVAIFSILFFSSLVFTQADGKNSNNFNGTWVLDKSKSDAGSGLRVTFNDTTIIVVQDENSIKMTTKVKKGDKESVDDTTYYLDERDNDKKPNSDGEQRSTKWNGKKLVISTKSVIRAITVGGRNPTMEIKEEWELSKDGGMLTRTISSTGMPGMMPPTKSKFVFSRGLSGK